MKKKQIAVLIIAIALVATAILTIWYLSPTTFLNGVEPSDIKLISVFDGSTGKSFDISDTDEIRSIVENIQGVKMGKDTLSIYHSGFSFRMDFYDETGEKIESFILNSANTIRKDPFFYHCDGKENLCFDYLKELEEKYSG